MSMEKEINELEDREWIQLPPGKTKISPHGRNSTRNPYYIEGDVAHVGVCDKSGKISGEFLIDVEDLERTIYYARWYIKKGMNCAGNNQLGGILFHRWLLDCLDSKLDVDHINGIRTDNRKSNLRLCTRQQNMFNCGTRRNKKYKGVKQVGFFSRGATKDRWEAVICVGGICTHLGRSDSEEEAARMYDRAAIKYHEEFVRTNFPLSDYAKESS